MRELNETAQHLEIFSNAPEGVIFCLEVKRRDLSFVQKSLSVLPVRFDQSVYCLDGVNAFDPYPFSKAARLAGFDVEDVLDRVYVSRSFTIHQIRASVERLLPPLMKVHLKPLVMVLGIEHLFLEESLPMWERKYTLQKTIERLQKFRDGGLPVLMTCEPEGEQQIWWRPILQAAGDKVARLNISNAGEPSLTWIKKQGEQNDGKNTSNLQHIPSG